MRQKLTVTALEETASTSTPFTLLTSVHYTSQVYMTYAEVSLNKQNESHVLVDKVRSTNYESFRYVTL